MGACHCVFSVGILCLGTLLYIVFTRMGLGKPFPSALYSSLSPLLPNSSFEIVAELDTPPGNLAVSSSGRVFFNFHPEYSPVVKIAELSGTSHTSWKAFPDVSFQSQITTVLSMRIDSANNRLWLLDFGLHGILRNPALIAISLENDTQIIKYSFPKTVAGVGSMLNDFAINANGHYLYIADTSIVAQTPAIIVYSVKKNNSFRLLSSLSSLYGQSSFFNVHLHQIGFGPFGMKINVDSIALSRDNRALYFAPLTGSELLCVDVALLHAAAMCTTDDIDCRAHQALSQGVQVVLSDKPITDGITTDEDGNVWLTALGHSSIGLASPVYDAHPASDASNISPQGCGSGLDSVDKQCQLPGHYNTTPDSDSDGEVDNPCRILRMHNVIHNSDLLRWADGFSFGPDGLYITNSALYMKFNNLPLPSEAPYHILKLKAEDLLHIKQNLKVAATTATATIKPSASSSMSATGTSEENVKAQDYHENAEVTVALQEYFDVLKTLAGQ